MKKLCANCRQKFKVSKQSKEFCPTCLAQYMPTSAKRNKLTQFLSSQSTEKLLAFETLICEFVDNTDDLAFEMTCGELSIVLLLVSQRNAMPQMALQN